MTDHAQLLEKLIHCDIEWIDANEEFHYQTSFEKKTVILSLNDFPDENILTVFIGDSSFELEETPRGWSLPGWKKSV
jgi:hypothetical protein